MKIKEMVEEKAVTGEEPKYCANCGNKLLASDKFCRQCDASVE